MLDAGFITIFFFLSSIQYQASVRLEEIVIYSINLSVSPHPAGQEGGTSLELVGVIDV
jgi:hypothetical protein